jgi:aspartyl-tRNA(Asn)/glutamyl-tRNA(Gln) amidotransferase subunit A
MARTAEDCALILNAIAGHDPADPASAQRPVPDFRIGLDVGIKGLRIGVIRHFWEKDLPMTTDLAAALENSIAVFRDLGAIVEDVALRPLRSYSDVKIVTAESELFSLHLSELIARPLQFGQDFRARSLAACLFTAEDYVRASRERRAILGEMRPLYRQFDLFLTANTSAAPRLDQHDILSFWTRPNLTSPFNCTGGPALAVLCGFGREGLPLSLQIAGRPFDDARVLRAGHAFERAAGLYRRRPMLTPGAKPAAIEPRPWRPDTSKVGSTVRAQAEAAATRCGLRLPDQIMEELVAVAPSALAMAARLGRQHAREDETASTFDPGRAVD